MLWGFQQKIWFYQSPVDFRKQLDGLIILVASQLKLDPTSGQLFIFRNRHANKLKILWWDENGFWLLYKRLEESRFKFPKISQESMAINREQFQFLLAGIDFEKHQFLPRVYAKNFF